MRVAAVVILLGLVMPAAASPPSPGAGRVSARSSLADAAPWPVVRGNAQGAGRRDGNGSTPSHQPPRLPWRFPTDGGVVAAPVIDAAERIFVGAADGMLYAFDPLEGRELWRVSLGAPVTTAAALGADGVLYVAAGPRLSALTTDGVRRWTFDARHDRDRRRPTLGVTDGWHGGIVIGPGGRACAGNDDFFFYCLDPDGSLAWAARTGLPIWGAAAFGRDGTVYVASLDMRVYALESASGQERWRRDLDAPLGTAPAVGDDGTVYVGALDGQVHALDGGTGALRWSMRTGGPVVAAAAVAADGTVYVPSTDGRLYALNGASGTVRWAYWFGNPVRSSPAIGPDPEGTAEHLVYVGAVDGTLHAVAPDGRRRWMYDGRAHRGLETASNLDAGPALGRYGAAIGSAAGAVLYVPYDYYLRDDAQDIVRTAEPPPTTRGPSWHLLTPAGLLERPPLPVKEAEAETISVGRTQVVTLRAVDAEATPRPDPMTLPGGVTVQGTHVPYHADVLGDRCTLALVSPAILPGGATLPLSVSARIQAGDGRLVTLEGRAVFVTEPESVENPIALRLQRGFRVENVALSQPALAATLVPAGTNAIRLSLAVVEMLPERRTFAAWGLQRGASVDAVGSTPRTLLYALRGRWSGDAIVLDAEAVDADVGGVVVPIDRLRLGGRFVPGGRLASGATVLVETGPRGLWSLLNSLVVNGATIGSSPSWLGTVFRRGSVVALARAAVQTVPTVARVVARRLWEPLQLVNPAGDVVAVGTFDMTALPAADLAAPTVKVRSFVPDAAAGRVVADVTIQRPDPAALPPLVAILLVDTASGAPVPLAYNRLLTRERGPDGQLHVELSIPSDVRLLPGHTRAHVMADLAAIATVDF